MSYLLDLSSNTARMVSSVNQVWLSLTRLPVFEKVSHWLLRLLVQLTPHEQPDIKIYNTFRFTLTIRVVPQSGDNSY